MIVISHIEAKKILDADLLGLSEVDTSLDLGISRSTVELGSGKVKLGKEWIALDEIRKVVSKPQVCWLIQHGRAVKVQFFNNEKFYKLVPTRGAPTFEISGIHMHVISSMDPMEDTRRKMAEVDVKGKVLDTCMGLGYTAIMAAVKADEVLTCEVDKNVIELCKYNPWSEFPGNVKVMNKSVVEAVKEFKQEFDCIIHDPPSYSLAPELYTREFYSDLFRILKEGGTLYHYTGLPGSRNKGIDLPANTKEKLLEAGFSDIRNAHYGIAAKR